MSNRFESQSHDPYEPSPLDKMYFMSERLCAAVEACEKRTPLFAAKNGESIVTKTMLFKLYREAMKSADQRKALYEIFDTTHICDIWLMSATADDYERVRLPNDPPSFFNPNGGLFSED